jgi:hypothetical protein
MPIPSKDGDALRRENVTDAPEHTYGLIAADSKTQTVAKAAGLFTRRLCARGTVRGFFEENPAREHCGESDLANGRYFGNAALQKKVRPALGGEPAAREPGLGTGRGGDVTELA